MTGHTRAMDIIQVRSSLRSMLLMSGSMTLVLLAARPILAANVSVPWECSNYDGDAQIRCLNTFIELQRDKIAQLEGELQAQRGTVGQLKEQIDRQVAATADFERQLSDRPPQTIVPTPYAYSYPYPFPYVYPPGFGLGLYFGRPWVYGPSFAFSPYWGFRLHRHWGHRR